MILPEPKKIKHDKQSNAVNHPSHYNNLGAKCHHCGEEIECIDIAEHMGFNRGNAFKYIFRCYDKVKPIEDLKKAIWYIQREIDNIEKQAEKL